MLKNRSVCRYWLPLLIFLILMPVWASGEVYLTGEKPSDWEERNLLRLTVFAAGRSDCMLLECGGESMLVDGGLNGYREKLKNALETRGLTRLKWILNTHPHDDHVEGILRLLEWGFTCDELLSPFPENYNDPYQYQQKLVSRLQKAGIPYHQIADGDQFSLGGATVTVLHNAKGSTANDRSAVLHVRLDRASVLLTADAPGETQHYYAENGYEEFLDVDILKACHHGITPIVADFLTAASPELVFVTNFKNDEISRLTSQLSYRAIPALYAGQGTIVMETDGTDWYVVQNLKQF